MRLKALLTLCGSLIAGMAAAQPTLTPATSNPVIGSTTNYHRCTIASAGDPGAGKIWNFDTLTSAGAMTLTYEPCADSNRCSLYPGTTIVASLTADSVYRYMLADANRIAVTGMRTSNDSQQFSNPMDVLRYPITYTNSFSDDFWSVYKADFVSATEYGEADIIADAYGTLKLPGLTYSSVLRVHRTVDYHFTDTAFGSIDTIDYTIEYYDWYVSSLKSPVLSLSTEQFGPDGPLTGVYYQWPLGIEDFANGTASVTLFPNPATDEATLSLNVQQKTDISVQITDVSGKTVQQFTRSLNAGSNTVAITTSDLQQGIYFVNLQSASGSYTTKLTVIH